MTTKTLPAGSRPGAVLPVQVRTARKRHACDDCQEVIEPGDKYELSVSPPHRIDVYDVDHWLTWRTHYPRHDGGRFLPGCEEASGRREKAEREARDRTSVIPDEDLIVARDSQFGTGLDTWEF